VPHSLLLEVFTTEGVGTMVLPDVSRLDVVLPDPGDACGASESGASK
jgi:hypothetical protein